MATPYYTDTPLLIPGSWSQADRDKDRSALRLGRGVVKFDKPSWPVGQANSPTSDPDAANVDPRRFLHFRVDLLDRFFGHEFGQASPLEHQSGNNGSGNEDQRGPQERRRVAVELSSPEIGRGESPTDEVRRNCTGGQCVEE